ncbi:hypothetical protein [Blastococcus sp. DSM 46786]|uniref:hypothetical protein n=1 Tax=Blastococcus sp. DSM 46786 TaxID=1798227 RepID=UPI001B8B6D7E|nr:hypothetical protein [Blastococcus sp. DSM 46786]
MLPPIRSSARTRHPLLDPGPDSVGPFHARPASGCLGRWVAQPPEDALLTLAAGWSDAEATEASVHIALNLFTNHFNHLVQTDLDVPPAPGL